MSRIVDTSRLDLMFGELQKRVINTYPVMRQLSGDMLNAVEENFEKEGRLPKWKRLKSSTLINRKKKGKSGKILSVNGQLAASMQIRSNRSEAIVGTNKIYASTHQFGAKKGQFGKDKHGRPIPWGDVPSRPFLKFTARDVKQFSKTIMEHLIDE